MKESISQLKPLINKRKLIIEVTTIIQWNSFYSHFQFNKLKLREIKQYSEPCITVCKDYILFIYLSTIWLQLSHIVVTQ